MCQVTLTHDFLFKTDGYSDGYTRMVDIMGKVEGVVEDYLRKECNKRGYLCYKWVSPGHIGVPDDIVIGNGLTVYVECKSAVGHLIKMQKVITERLAEHGADVRVVYSKEDVDDVLETLDSVKRWKKREVIDYRELRNTKEKSG